MNKPLVIAVVFSLITACVSIAETVNGQCTLVYDQRGRTISQQVELGSVVKGKCDFKLQSFGGAKAIIANGEFTNTGDKPMGFAYYVSFFDENDNLVGSANFAYFDKDTALDAGKSMRSASCIIKIPDSIGENVTSYQVALYDFEQIE